MAVVPREILIVYGSVAVGSVAAASGGNTEYTMEDTNGDGTVPSWIAAGTEINFYASTNSANDGTFTVVSVAGLVVTVNNPAGVLEAGSPGLAGFPVAGPSNFHMHDRHRKGADYRTRTYDFDVVISSTGADPENDFNVRTLSIERAFRSIRQRFRYVFDGSVRDDLNPAAASGGNTGFNQTSRIEKVGDDFDTGRSRKYHVTIEAQLPADHPGVSGRQDSTVDLRFEASRRRVVTLSGRYTALGANNSRAQYNTAIGTYVTAVLNGLGGTYELVSEMAVADDQDKNLDFQRTYEEIIYSQSSSTFDHASIVQGRYTYSRQQLAPGDSDSTARRLEVLTVDFDASVDKDVTVDLESLWTGTVRPYLISQALSQFRAGAGALVDIQPNLDRSTNRISARLTLHVAAEGGGGLVQATQEVRVENNTGKILVPVWDGNVLAKHVYDGPARAIRTKRSTKLYLGSVGLGSNPGPNSPNVGLPGAFTGGIGVGAQVQFVFANGFTTQIFGSNSGAAQTALVNAAINDIVSGQPTGLTGWVLMMAVITVRPIFLGLPGHQLELSEVEVEQTEEYVAAPS